jgi:quercetin dioxygenase-like cupin family protein
MVRAIDPGQHRRRVRQIGTGRLAGRCREVFLQGVRSVADTTVKKVSAAHSPKGEMGQTYLVSGKHVSMRLWQSEPEGTEKRPSQRDYETVGYVLGGRAELHLAGQKVLLEKGDSWLVPAGAEHSYTILERFSAVEATAPPAQVHGRDAPR